MNQNFAYYFVPCYRNIHIWTLVQNQNDWVLLPLGKIERYFSNGFPWRWFQLDNFDWTSLVADKILWSWRRLVMIGRSAKFLKLQIYFHYFKTINNLKQVKLDTCGKWSLLKLNKIDDEMFICWSSYEHLSGDERQVSLNRPLQEARNPNLLLLTPMIFKSTCSSGMNQRSQII